jgi:tRNA (guanine-N7-)-methyltransferase
MLKKLNYLDVDWPLDYSALFPALRPLIVEIGFGNGDYLIHLAQTHPDHNVLGFEISGQSMTKAESKIERLKLSNVRPIHGTAETALAHLLAPESVTEFHINFPDPWFKKRHHRRRLLNRDTVKYLSSRLTVGGTLSLATDIVAYAEIAHETLSNAAGLCNALDSAWVNEMPGRFQTKYEAKAYREGRRAYFFVYRRNNTAVPHPPLITEAAMPHLFLHSPLNAAALAHCWHGRYPAHSTLLRCSRSRSGWPPPDLLPCPGSCGDR